MTSLKSSMLVSLPGFRELLTAQLNVLLQELEKDRCFDL